MSIDILDRIEVLLIRLVVSCADCILSLDGNPHFFGYIQYLNFLGTKLNHAFHP